VNLSIAENYHVLNIFIIILVFNGSILVYNYYLAACCFKAGR